MQKIKFEIQGMHCQSCATLIEERLKKHPAVLEGKVNYESQKGAVVYDQSKINQSDIHQIIKEVGDFQVNEIDEIGVGQNVQAEAPLPILQDSPRIFSKISLFLKILTALSVLSLILNFILINKVSNVIKAQGQEKTGVAKGQNLPPQSDPSPTQDQPGTPTPQPAKEQLPIQNFEITQDDHIRGNFDAPITLVEFSDFECPFCARHYPTLQKIVNDYPEKVRLVYKHFPLSFHPNAQKASESSECASEQGQFWEYHDKLFENLQTGYSLDNFKNWAKDLGLDEQQFNACLDSGKYAQKVKADFQEGSAKGVNGTPATFINGQLVSGALPYETLQQIIESELK